MAKVSKCRAVNPISSKKIRKSKNRTAKDKLNHAELSLHYDDPLCYRVELNATLKDISFALDITDSKEMKRMVALQLASVALVEMGLPTIQEILEKYYPEAFL